jgi:hypothetical protein
MRTSSAGTFLRGRSPSEWLFAAFAAFVIGGVGYKVLAKPSEPVTTEDFRYLESELNRLKVETSTVGSWGPTKSIFRTSIIMSSSFQTNTASVAGQEVLTESLKSLRWQPHQAESQGSLSEFCKGRFRAILELHQAQLLVTLRVKELASQEVCGE